MSSITGDGVAVYHGPWYNNAEKLWILTLTNMEANYLLAAIALYITFYSQDFWYVIRWILHTLRYHNPDSQHVMEHQLQVAIRNSGNPASYLYKCIHILHAWRKVPGVKAWRKCGIEIFYSLLIFGAWILAAVFISAAMEEVPKDVLLSLAPDASCGMEFKNWSLQPEEQLPWLRYREETVVGQMPRVDGCWFGNWTESSCRFYPVPKFEMESEDAECPLANQSMCTAKPIEFTIGPVRSDHDLGIDTAPKDAIAYNRKSTCSPIDLSSLESEIVVDQDLSVELGVPKGSKIKTFDIGKHVHINGEDPVTLPILNTTAVAGYFLNVWQDTDPEGSVFWRPRPELFSEEKNWNLFFLRQVDVRYTKPINDAWFQATLPAENRSEDSLRYKIDLFKPNSGYSAMACTTEHQICKVDSDYCTPWHKLTRLDQPLALSDANISNWSRTQEIVIQRVVNETSRFSTASIVQDLSPAALYVSHDLYENINIADVSDRQWAREVERWIAASMAVLQSQTTAFVKGFAAQVGDAKELVPGPPELQALCTRQRVLQTGVNTRNFNFIGVLLCFLLGLVVNTLGLFGVQVNGLVQRFRSSRRPHMDWNQDGLFQLHRQHLEQEGVTGWTGLDKEIPVVDTHVERSTWKTAGGLAEGKVLEGEKQAGVVMSVQQVV